MLLQIPDLLDLEQVRHARRMLDNAEVCRDARCAGTAASRERGAPAEVLEERS